MADKERRFLRPRAMRMSGLVYLHLRLDWSSLVLHLEEPKG